jgi:hypothetical protein
MLCPDTKHIGTSWDQREDESTYFSVMLAHFFCDCGRYVAFVDFIPQRSLRVFPVRRPARSMYDNPVYAPLNSRSPPLVNAIEPAVHTTQIPLGKRT